MGLYISLGFMGPRISLGLAAAKSSEGLIAWRVATDEAEMATPDLFRVLDVGDADPKRGRPPARSPRNHWPPTTVTSGLIGPFNIASPPLFAAGWMDSVAC